MGTIRTSVSWVVASGLTGLSRVTTTLLLGQALRARCEGATCPPRAQSQQSPGSTPSRPGSLSESRSLAPSAVGACQAACARRTHRVRRLTSVNSSPDDRPERSLGNVRLDRWVAWNRPGASGAGAKEAAPPEDVFDEGGGELEFAAAFASGDSLRPAPQEAKDGAQASRTQFGPAH